VAALIVLSVGAMACGSSAATETIADPAAPTETDPPTIMALPQTPWPSVIALPAELPASPTYDQLLPLFDYQGDRPFATVDVSTTNSGGAIVDDVIFMGAAGEPVEAYLVMPVGEGPFAGVLYEHGSNGSRADFLPEATAVAAQQHIAGLVVTQPDWTMFDDALTETIYQVREMRRALDFLASQPQVDRARLGYVGHSLGAILGTVLLSVDTRVKAAVMMSVVPGYGLPSLDLSLFAPHITSGTLLFQFGVDDSYYTQDEANGFAALVPTKKTVTWYNAGHVLNATARSDRAAWLGSQLVN
jgi:dienelactone hydrolase